MNQFVAATFSGETGVTLQTSDPNWIRHPASQVNLNVTPAGRVRGEGAALTALYRHATPAPQANYRVSADIINISSSTPATLGVCVRMSATVENYYHGRLNTIDGKVQIYRFNSGSPLLLNESVLSMPTGDVKRIDLDIEDGLIRLYVNGGEDPAASASDSLITAAGYIGIRARANAAITDTTGLHLDNLSADTPGGGGAITLTGANSTQTNDSTNGAVTQAHALSGISVTQSNTATTAAITQVHALAGENSTQENIGSTGVVGGSINLTGAAGSQSNTASAAAITQTHTLAGANGAQTNAAGVGAISQAHALAGESSNQTNLGSTAALGELTITLTGAAGSQSNSGTTGAIAQLHALSGAQGSQTNLASVAAITQAHALVASNSAQVNLGSIGAIVVAGVTYWPAPEQVLVGVTYGPTGTEYRGTAAAGLIVAEAVNFVIDPDVARLTIEPDIICLTVR